MNYRRLARYAAATLICCTAAVPFAAEGQEQAQSQTQAQTQAQPPQETQEKKETIADDPRVKQALDKLKYKYAVNANKAYEMTFTLKDKRTQAVFVNSSTQKYGKVEIREVTSTAYRVRGKLAIDQALRLLADNDRRKWGGWRIVEEGEFTFVIYAVQLPADADVETLDNAIDAVMFTADEMEKEITKADDF